MTTKVDQLSVEVQQLRTDVASLANLITKDVIPSVLVARDALDGVVAATETTVEKLESATAIEYGSGCNSTSPIQAEAKIP